MNKTMSAMQKRGMLALPMIRKKKHGRGANATLGAVLLLCFFFVFVGAGCHEPDDRTEVTGNGEGGVNIQRPEGSIGNGRTTARTGLYAFSFEQRVEVLEATVFSQQEIATLRGN